jgi:hypothetical protein
LGAFSILIHLISVRVILIHLIFLRVRENQVNQVAPKGHQVNQDQKALGLRLCCFGIWMLGVGISKPPPRLGCPPGGGFGWFPHTRRTKKKNRKK